MSSLSLPLRRLLAALPATLALLGVPAVAAGAEEDAGAGVALLTLDLTSGTEVVGLSPAPGAEPAQDLTAARAQRRALARSSQQSTEYVVEVLDAASRVTYRTTVGAERRVRSEHPVDPDGAAPQRIERHEVPDARQVVTLPVPLAGADRVRVLRPGDGALRTAPAVELPAAAAPDDVELVRLPGYPLDPAGNRLNIVILGDGYTAAESGAFARDAKEVADGLLEMSPYADYTDFFNVVAAFGPSAQSGADHPPYRAGCAAGPAVCCPETGAPATGSWVDTRYDSTYCWNGIQRLLVPGDPARVEADASAVFPQWDQLLLVVNDAEYGGSGGSIATASRHPVGVSTMQHELGHSLLRLMDEYYGPGNPPLSCSDRPSSPLQACGPNITDLTARADLKWRRWVQDSTPIPTPSPQPPSVVGLFQGGNYHPTQYYRACDMCMMNAMGTEFGPVEREQMPVRLYEQGIRLVEPGSAAPDPAVPIAAGHARRLSARVLSPGSGPATRVRWLVDGTAVASEVVTDGTVSFDWAPTDGGPHRVTLEATDVAGLLHPELRALSRSRVTWQVGRDGDYGELLGNGGFESALGNGWPTHTTPNGFRTCGKAARSGRCALRARLRALQGYLLGQSSQPRLWPGDRVTLSGAFDSKNLRAKVVVVARITLNGGGVQRLTLRNLPRDARDRKGYVRRSASAVLPKSAKKVSVQVRLPKGSGTVWIDDLSLVARPPA